MVAFAILALSGRINSKEEHPSGAKTHSLILLTVYLPMRSVDVLAVDTIIGFLYVLNFLEY